MKILVVFTGGTIGSRVAGNEISPDNSAKYRLIEEYRRHFGSDIEFSFTEPYTLLSENSTASNINLLIQTVKENLDAGYDGIIVTHGTDTLQFSASALSLSLGNACTPVLLASSNYPLSDPRANGQAHFSASIKLIAERRSSGVLVPYLNEVGDVVFYRPYALLSFSERDDKLGFLTDCRYAVINKSGVIIKLSREQFLKPRDFILTDSPEILVIDPHPADSYSYNLDGVNAVILRPYHSGTLPTSVDAFKRFCQRAKDLKVPLFVVGAPSGTTYESVSLFSSLGLIPLTDSAYINSYVKVWVGTSLELKGERLVNFVKE